MREEEKREEINEKGMPKDYYKILGIDKTASEEEVRRAFHKLAHQHHPDKGGDSVKFKEINEAYQVLSNKEKRAQYDQFGQTFDGAQTGPGGFGGFGQGNWDFSGFSNQGDFEDIDLGDIFEQFFGGGMARGGKKKNIKRGRDIEVELELNLEEVLKSQEKEINLSKEIFCERCKGSGAEPGSKTKECFTCRGTGEVQQLRRTVLGSFTNSVVCPECKGEGTKPEKLCNVCSGEGRIKGSERIKIFIPAGVDSNQVIKVEGRGEAGKRGGKAGDLYVKIFIKKHNLFERRGDDIYLKIPITITQAVLGGEVEIPSLDGKNIVLMVPSGTESGKMLRITGKGVPHFTGYGKGNLYVELVIKTPKKITKEQKELLERLRREGL